MTYGFPEDHDYYQQGYEHMQQMEQLRAELIDPSMPDEERKKILDVLYENEGMSRDEAADYEIDNRIGVAVDLEKSEQP